MCILEAMRGNDIGNPWEFDLGPQPDDMGTIMEKGDGERMEAELFSRLGGFMDRGE